MKIKQRIHDLCFSVTFTKKLYCTISYCKRKVYYWFLLVKPILKYKRENKKPVFLVFTPEHANLGDHAIAFSEKRMLDKMGLEYYEITGRNLTILNQFGFLQILDKALILVNGGGNLGTLWPEIEYMNRRIITENANACIYVLPNSIYYDNNETGKEEFEKSKEIYNSHKRLFLYAREKISYNIMKDAYNHVKLIPDMVLFLNEVQPISKRNGCLICLRNDVEQTLTISDKERVVSITRGIFQENIKITDTVLDYFVALDQREAELSKKFEEFRNAELVITDRLHGMIFAAITATNCIVLNSKSPKLKGCYEWISDLEYIEFIDEVNSIEEVYMKMRHKENKFDNSLILKYLSTLENDIYSAYETI